MNDNQRGSSLLCTHHAAHNQYGSVHLSSIKIRMKIPTQAKPLQSLLGPWSILSPFSCLLCFPSLRGRLPEMQAARIREQIRTHHLLPALTPVFRQAQARPVGVGPVHPPLPATRGLRGTTSPSERAFSLRPELVTAWCLHAA